MLDERPGSTLPESSPTPLLAAAAAAQTARIDGDRFVGRTEELARLRGAFDAAREGRGSLFLISGEAGIGKTRLAFEISSEARARDVRVVWGRCWEAGGAPPYWPWIEVLRQLLADTESTPHDGLGRHAAQLARLVPEAFPGTEPAAAPADPDSGRFLLFDAVAATLRIASKRRPVLVVIDDLHAADRASALLLAFLARAVNDCGAVLIGTYRDAEAHSTPALVDALGELSRSASRIALGGLDTSGVRAVLEGWQGAPPAAGLVDRIHRVTDGNPFFVREIVRLLATDSVLDDAGSFRIPDGIRETVRRRLHPLSAPVRALLAIAAVAGREFDAVMVSRAATLEMIEFLDLLEPAIAHAVVDEIPGSGGRFSFRHALIRETIFDDLSPAVRIRLHGDVRDALEQLFLADPDRYAAELAHHALAAAPLGDERFVEHGVRAARSAMQHMAFEEAVRVYERTIDAMVHARPDERRRCELLLALAEAKEWANDLGGSREAVEEAAEIARSLDAPELLARAALAVGAIEALKATASSRCETAASLLRETLAMGDRIDRATRARLRSRLALHYLTSGERSEALSESASAVSDARSSEDLDCLAHVLIARHAVLLGPDFLDERCAIAMELLDLAARQRSFEYEIRAHALRIVNALELGDILTVDEAGAVHDKLNAIAQDPFERWASIMWRCARALLVGRFEEAVARANEGLELTTTVPGPHAFEINGPAAYLGQLLLIEDTRYGTMPDPDQFEVPRAKFHEVLAWHVARLQALTRLCRTEDVRTEVEQLMARGLPDADRTGTWLVAITTLAQAVALLGDRVHAAQLYPKLLSYAQHNVIISFVACRGSVSRFLGLLAATLGNHEDAGRHFEDALAMNRRMGALPHVAATLHDYAVALIGTPTPEHVERALGLCREALSIARDLGMNGLVVLCDELLAAHGASTLPGAPRTEFELVPRGAFWSVAHGGNEVLVKNRKGLHYVAELLRNPDRDVHVRTLVALFGPADAPAPDPRVTKPQVVRDVDAHSDDFSEHLVDPKARRAYERRLAELDDELDAAGGFGDPEHLAVLREERDALRQEMSRITGLGGRPRRIDDGERMRVAVTRAIRNALSSIVDASPEIGGALARRIRTGNSCRYSSTAPD